MDSAQPPPAPPKLTSLRDRLEEIVSVKGTHNVYDLKGDGAGTSDSDSSDDDDDSDNGVPRAGGAGIGTSGHVGIGAGGTADKSGDVSSDDDDGGDDDDGDVDDGGGDDDGNGNEDGSLSVDGSHDSHATGGGSLAGNDSLGDCLEDDLFVMEERRMESKRAWLDLTRDHLDEFLELNQVRRGVGGACSYAL